MGAYFDALTESMTELAKDPRVVFLGQSVGYTGQRAHKTFSGVPDERKLEMPICEDLTVGFATGLALGGFVPLVFIPRWDFLILAANQIVNHLDKIANARGFVAKVIIRTSAGASKPLDPGEQHVGNYSLPFAQMLRRTMVYDCLDAEDVKESYWKALNTVEGPSIVVERMSLY